MVKARRFGLTLFLVVALVGTPGVLAQRQPIGFVLSLQGRWLADGQPLQLGQEVLAGSAISLSPETTIDSGRSITVILADSTKILHPCDAAPVCRFTLPASLNAPTTAFSRLADAFNLIFKRSDRYVAALSRGPGTEAGNLADGVMKIEAGRFDPAPLMHDIDAGQYLLRFRALSADEAPPEAVSTVRVDWRATGSRVALPASMGPGLYKVSLFSATPPDADQLGDDAWSLLAAPPLYERTSAAFEEAAATARSWGMDVPAKDRRLFLRATLDHLALAR
jgi:hypothetical protein